MFPISEEVSLIVEPLSDARTPLADFFSILLGALLLLRRWEILRWRRQGTLPGRCRAPAVRRAGLTALGRIRKVQLHLIQLTLRDPPPILTSAASRHRRAANFAIALGTESTDGQQISPQWDTLNEGGIAILANLFGLGHARGRIAFKTCAAGLADTFWLARLLGLHGHGPQPQ